MKNIKFDGKKLLSLITAGMLMAGPVAASADGEENTNTGFTLVRQEMKVDGYDLNIGRYIENLEDAFLQDAHTLAINTVVGHYMKKVIDLNMNR